MMKVIWKERAGLLSKLCFRLLRACSMPKTSITSYQFYLRDDWDWDDNLTLAPVAWEDMANKPMFQFD